MLLGCLSVSILAVACASLRTQTTTDVDRTIRPDGTIIEHIHSTTTTSSEPVGGTITVNVAGVGSSLGVTTQNGAGETTKTEVPEGGQAEIPKDTESVTTETETTQPCPQCGEVDAVKLAHSSRISSSGSSSIPLNDQRRIYPYEFRTEYRAWPNTLVDVSACVSIKGRLSTPRRDVEARSDEIGNYFRQVQMGLTSNGIPTGAPLPSFANVEVIVREILFVEPTSTGANFHYYDTLPFEWLVFTLNGTDYSLQTPGATNSAAPSGWYHAVIPVPASALQMHSTYASIIKRQGSNQLGGRSMVVELENL